MWGFLQSIFVSVPLKSTRSLKSNSAVMLWCAIASFASNMTSKAIESLILWTMGTLLERKVKSLWDESNGAASPPHAEPKRHRQARYNDIRTPRTLPGRRGGPPKRQEVKQDRESESRHLSSKRITAQIFSGGGHKDHQPGENRHRRGDRHPWPELPRESGGRELPQSKPGKPYVHCHNGREENRQAGQMNRLNQGHAVPAVPD